MLSRARFEDLPELEDDEEEIEDGFFVSAINNDLSSFRAEDYERDLHQIGKFLQENYRQPTWDCEKYKGFQRKATKFFLRYGFFWRRSKKASGTPSLVLGRKVDKGKVLTEFLLDFMVVNCEH
jgi:hypothetical protein